MGTLIIHLLLLLSWGAQPHPRLSPPLRLPREPGNIHL